MNINSSLYGSEHKAYNLDITTSTGDHISLDLSKRQEASFEEHRTANSISQSFSYKSVEEFNFSYVGNGLDSNDIKEIKQALEKAGPLMSEFMEGFSDEMKNAIAINPQTQKIADIFAPIKDTVDTNTLNFAKDLLVKQMEEIVKSLNNKDLIKEGAEFLKKLFDNIDKEQLFIYG